MEGKRGAHWRAWVSQARVVGKKKTVWARVKSGTQGVIPKDTQRQLAGALKERPWLAPAGVMASVMAIFAFVWIWASAS